MKVSRLILCRDCYKSQEEFENEIKKAVMLLLNSEHIMTIRYDEKDLGIVVIEYDSDDLNLCAHYPYWLSSTEIQSVVFDDERSNNEI